MREASQKLPTALRDQFQTPNGQLEFVQAVLAKRLLRAEAERRGITRSPDIVQQVRELEERLAIQALLADAQRVQGPPSEPELRAYFDARKAEFRQPTRVRVSRVLLRGRADDRGLRAKLEAIRQRALTRDPVSKLASLGEGPEVSQGGDIGWVTETVDEETTAALALKKAGDVSPIVSVASGLAILIATAREEAHEASFEEVRQVVVGRYAPVQQRRAFDDLVKRLKEDVQAQVNTAAFP
ncbi:MAG: peptidylprolyl isomerase [Myxococcales bacterium]|nr:peptidylprolyl isomerase [Myxococcales bacterium]